MRSECLLSIRFDRFKFEEQTQICSKWSFLMAKKPSNSGTPWTPAAVKQLKELAKGNTPTRVIGLKMGRTEGSIYSKASDEGISLAPTNQSPYGTKP